MTVHVHPKELVISDNLIKILQVEIERAGLSHKLEEGVVLNFRDPNYSVEHGGYHPVEIAINSAGEIQYITDFAYVGDGYFAELAKEIDFDFSLGIFQHFGRDYPIRQGAELFQIWQENFCSYYDSGVFQVSAQSLY